MTSPLNVALIGYGYAGRTLHAPLLSATPALLLHTIVSSNTEQIRQEHPGVRIASDVTQALVDPAIDLIVIASPNDSHFLLADTALAAGKHVVVDKPFTITLAQAQQLQIKATHHQRVLSVFHNRRWDADFLTLCHLLRDGTLGDIVLFESRFEHYHPQIQPRWRESGSAGNGLWYELGPHLLDQTLQLFGRPRAIHADFAAQRCGAAVTDYFHVQLHYGRLRVRLSASSLISGGSPRFALHGTLGSYVKYGRDTQEAALKHGGTPGEGDWGIDTRHGLRYWQEEGEEHGLVVPTQNGDYRCYYNALASAIQHGSSNPVTPAEAIAVMQLIELGQESAYQGRELPVNPI